MLNVNHFLDFLTISNTQEVWDDHTADGAMCRVCVITCVGDEKHRHSEKHGEHGGSTPNFMAAQTNNDVIFLHLIFLFATSFFWHILRALPPCRTSVIRNGSTGSMCTGQSFPLVAIGSAFIMLSSYCCTSISFCGLLRRLESHTAYSWKKRIVRDSKVRFSIYKYVFQEY
jgi:hypothetical protein